jgi:hypothetical protein
MVSRNHQTRREFLRAAHFLVSTFWKETNFFIGAQVDKISDIRPVLERARLIGLRESHLCDLTGIAPTTMNRAKNATAYLPANDWLACKNLVLDCEELARRSRLPIAWTDIRRVREQIQALREERKNPPGQPTPQDWKILGLLGDPAANLPLIAEELGLTLSQLSAEMGAAIRRFDFCANALAARNADIGALSEMTVAYVDERIKARASKHDTN